MRIKRKVMKRYVFFSLLIVIIFLYGPSTLGGYHWTKSAAIKDSFPFQSGKVVFAKKFDKHEIVILDTGRVKYAKLIENPMGLLYRSRSDDEISGETADKKMKISWSGRLRDDQFYDMVFAAQVLSGDIVKVVVSNDHQRNMDISLSEVKKVSTLYVEMDIHNGYAVNYTRLPHEKLGNFVFRGVNSEGKVVSVYY
jgi:hypothetical protein